MITTYTMKTWYFFDSSGARKGPHNAEEVRQLVSLHIIVPDTVLEVREEGRPPRKLLAGQITNLEFPEPRKQAPPLLESMAPAPRPPDEQRPCDLLAWLIGQPATMITECLGLLQSKRAYGVAKIPKARGGFREIHPPHDVLKKVQRAILERVLYQVPVHLIAHGFCRDRDILTNIAAHRSARTIFNLDLKDAFPSVHQRRVRANLEGHVRRLVSRQFGPRCTAEQRHSLLDLLVTLTTHNGSLPQGASTSPALLNIVCMRLDRDLFSLCGTHGLTVSRYADDITISSTQSAISGEIRKRIRSAISAAGWKINQRKVIYAQRSHGHAIEISGLIIQEDGRLSIAPDRRKAYRRFLLEQVASERIADDMRARAEGIIAFARRIYRDKCPADLARPIADLERRLTTIPRSPGRRQRHDSYGHWP